MSVGLNSNYNSTYRAPSSTNSTSLSDAATKNLLKKYNMELDYATSLLSRATTPEAKERCQLKINAANEKINSLTQPAANATQTVTPEVATPPVTIVPQEQSESLARKILNYESKQTSAIKESIVAQSSSAAAAAATTSTTVATPTAQGSSTAVAGTVADKSMQSVEAKNEIKPLLSSIAYYTAKIEMATTQETKDKWQAKIGEANQKILNIELKYAGVADPEADAQKVISTRLAEIATEFSASSSELASVKSDILNSPAPSGPGSHLASSTYSDWIEAMETKIQDLSDKCAELKAEEKQLTSKSAPAPLSSEEKSQMNNRLAQIPQESSLVQSKLDSLTPPKLSSNPTSSELTQYRYAQRSYSMSFAPLDYQKKMLKAEEADIQAKLAADAKTEAKTAIKTRLIELANEFAKNYADVAALVTPTINIADPAQSKAAVNERHDQYQTLVDAKNVLVAEETQLREQFAQLNKA